MKTSEIVAFLESEITWQEFKESHSTTFKIFGNRKDGAFVSSDAKLQFDQSLIFQKKHLKIICSLPSNDRWQFANLVSLCNFSFSNQECEEALYALCE
ncbi:hypothetical protein [Sessilibacter sp. MAH2]